MERKGGAGPLDGSLETLPSQVKEIIAKARASWLKNPEVVDILENFRHYRLGVSSEPPVQPAGGTLYLFNRKECRFFRKDGHNWRKKADGKTVRETHEKLKVGNEEVLNCYYAHADQDDGLQRRCYWLLNEAKEHIVLVHYLNCSSSRAAPPHPIQQGSANDLAALQQPRPPPPQQAGMAAAGGGPAMPGSVGLATAARQGGERQGQRGQQRRAAESSGLGGSPPGQEQEQAGGGYDRVVGGVASAAGGLGRRAGRPSSGGLTEGELELSGSLQQQGGPSGALDGHPSLADLQALSPGGGGLPSLAAGQLGGLHPHYAMAAAAAARTQAQQALGGPLPGNQGGFSFPSHHAWQPWFQEYGQQRQRGFEGAPELRAAAAGGGPGPGAPFGRASPPQDHRSPGLLAGAGLSQQPGMFGPQNGLPPHARSLLQSLSLGTDGDPQRLFPQMSLGLSRYNPEGSICQFLAELEQSLEHHQAQQLSSSAAAQQQPQQAQQRPSSMMYRLLQQWSEYSGTSLGSSLGLAQQAQQERGPDPAAAAANRALLSQVEAVLAALPGAAQHAQQARQAPSWRQPQLDIPPLDMALAGGAAPGGLSSDQGMPDWKNLFRLMSTAASAQGRAALLEGLSGDHSFAAAQQQLQRPASASDAGAILARLRQKQAQAQGASPRQQGIPEGDEQEQGERVGEGGGSRGAGGTAPMAAEGVGSGAERSLPLRAEDAATLPRSTSPGGRPEMAAGEAGPAAAFHAQDRAAAAQQAQQLAAWQRLLEKQESFAQRPAAGTAAPAAGRAAAADAPPRPASRQGQQQRPSSDNPPLHAQAAARFSGTGAIQGRADALAAAAAALGHDRREAALQQARFQRRLSMETDTSVPTMIERLGGGSLVEEAWVQQHPPPHTHAPQGAAAAGEAGTAGGKEASLRSLRREMSIDTPQQAPHLHHLPRQEGSAAGLGGLASPESSNASQLHALALIRQLNDLKDQVIQHLVESGTVGSDVIEQLVSTTRGTSATTISQPNPQPSQQQLQQRVKAEQQQGKVEVEGEPPNEDEGRRVGGVKEEGCSGGGHTLPEGEEQQQQQPEMQDGASGAAGDASREQGPAVVPQQESQVEPMDSDESPQAAAQQAPPGSPPRAPAGRDVPSPPGQQPREQAIPSEEKQQRQQQQEPGPQETGQQQPGLQESEEQPQEATGSAAGEESLQGGEAMAVEAAEPGQVEGLGHLVNMPVVDEPQVQPAQQEERPQPQQTGQQPQHGEQTGAPSPAPVLSRLPQAQPGSMQAGQQPGPGQGQEQQEGVHGGEATSVDGEATEHAEVGFVITDFTPSWDFVQGGSKMIITGSISGRTPPGGSPPSASAKSVEDAIAPPAPLSVWFGSRQAAADQVIPGVLRCTIPPAPLPGTVTLRVAATSPASPAPALPSEAIDKEGGGSVFEYRADVALLAQQ